MGLHDAKSLHVRLRLLCVLTHVQRTVETGCVQIFMTFRDAFFKFRIVLAQKQKRGEIFLSFQSLSFFFLSKSNFLKNEHMEKLIHTKLTVSVLREEGGKRLVLTSLSI